MESQIKISQFRVGESNYNYIIYSEKSKSAIVIDPLESALVLKKMGALDARVKYVINTHGHMDHIAANEDVSKATSSILAASEEEHIPGTQKKLVDGEVLTVDDISIKVLLTPGHTPGHICLLVQDEYLIVGDTLFLGGCGNCKFGGDPDQLFDSLQILKTLPDHLKIYCGHEYSLKNLDFCKTHDPENHCIDLMREYVQNQFRKGENPATTLAEEKRHNVFLRTDQDEVSQGLLRKYPELSNDSRSIFKKLRKLRNSF